MQFDLSGSKRSWRWWTVAASAGQRSSCTRRSRPSATRFESSRSSWGSSCSIGGLPVQLTAAGESVLAEGRRVLSQVELVGSVARQFTQGWEPRLLVIIDGILPLDPILDGLKTLAAERAPRAFRSKWSF